MVEFKRITRDNFKECINLKLKKGQDKFVADNVYSIAQAGVWEGTQSYAIYAEETMVGFIMYYFDADEKAGNLWRFMVAGENQGKGYGKASLKKMIEYFRGIEDCKKIFLSYVPGNESAEGLYRSVGFKPNGDIEHGEIVMELKLKPADKQSDLKGKLLPKIMRKTISQEIQMKYLIYLPEEYTEDKKWPLVLFLHGAGERGDDLELVKKHGPPKIVNQGIHYPFIMVSPQCPKDMWWPIETRELKAIMDDVCRLYPIDTSRVYVTGLSMGGYGTYSMVMEYPDMFAAAIPICGGISGENGVENLNKVPFWIFHGDADKTVPVDLSNVAAKSINAAGGKAKLTIYPGVGHNSWSETYENPAVFKWMLKQRR